MPSCGQTCEVVLSSAKLCGMETADAPSLGTQIRRARERKRWTQQELADAVEVGRDTVVKWENDQRAPKNRIGAIEEVLEIDLTGIPA